jgi:ER lumen protein retaining receptor
MFMNIFRITGDLCHLLSFVVMFWKLHTSRSVAG